MFKFGRMRRLETRVALLERAQQHEVLVVSKPLNRSTYVPLRLVVARLLTHLKLKVVVTPETIDVERAEVKRDNTTNRR